MRDRRGFTLLEVIASLGILTLTLFGAVGLMRRATDATLLASARESEIRKAEEIIVRHMILTPDALGRRVGISRMEGFDVVVVVPRQFLYRISVRDILTGHELLATVRRVHGQ